MELQKREPAAVAQLVQTALVALVGCLVAFGVWSPTDAQVAALVALYVAVAAIVTYWLRGQVYTQPSVDRIRAELAPPETPDGPYPNALGGQ